MLNRHPDPPAPPAPTPMAPPHLGLEWADVRVPLPRALSMSVRLPRTVLPPAAELAPFDDAAADMAARVADLERVEADAAEQWVAATRWATALADDADWTAERLRTTGVLPPPDEGPMAEHHWTLEAALTTAWRSGVAVDVARQDLAAHVARNRALRDELTRRCDQLHADATDLLLRARDHKDHRAWYAAKEDTAPAYWRAHALLTWAAAPASTSWRVEYTTVNPHGLGTIWAEAEAVITDRPLLEVPEGLRGDDAPPPAKPGTLPGERAWGTAGPPTLQRPVGA